MSLVHWTYHDEGWGQINTVRDNFRKFSSCVCFSCVHSLSFCVHTTLESNVHLHSNISSLPRVSIFSSGQKMCELMDCQFCPSLSQARKKKLRVPSGLCTLYARSYAQLCTVRHMVGGGGGAVIVVTERNYSHNWKAIRFK